MNKENPSQLVVYFQVLPESHAENPWVSYWYTSNQISGGLGFNFEAQISTSKLSMIEEVRQKHGHWCERIDFVEVEKLDVVMVRSGLWPKENKRAMTAETKKAVRSMFWSNQRLGIPIRHTVMMVFKLLHIDIGAVCEEAGFHRNYLNAALSGKRQPSDLIRAKMVEKIGTDPWQYAEWIEPIILHTETINLADLNRKMLEA